MPDPQVTQNRARLVRQIGRLKQVFRLHRDVTAALIAAADAGLEETAVGLAVRQARRAMAQEASILKNPAGYDAKARSNRPGTSVGRK